MKSILASLAALALMTASAAACGFNKTAGHHSTTVASLEETETPMSTAADAVEEQDAIDGVTTGAIAGEEAEAAE
ncbi:MAG: hypothetical protein R3D45_14190 [Rhizobiaceae bacterium]